MNVKKILFLVLFLVIAGNTFGYNFQIITNSDYTWKQAKNDAVARGGHLATIHSQSEWNNLLSVINSSQDAQDSINGGLTSFWIGGSDKGSEGDWYWVTDEPFTFALWDTANGQPDNEGTGENYLRITSGGGDFLWNDSRSGVTFEPIGGYVLELAAIPEPSSYTLILSFLVFACLWFKLRNKN